MNERGGPGGRAAERLGAPSGRAAAKPTRALHETPSGRAAAKPTRALHETPSGRAAAKPTRALDETLTGRAAGPARALPGTLLAPIAMRTAGERIAERIVTAIALGEFVPGQRLPTERELAAMLEVSRTTVREALQRLQASGYVTTRRGRGGGTFVTTGQGPDSDEMIRRTLVPAWADLSEILDFRRLIEQLIARTAAQRRDERDIDAIRRAVDDYARAADREASRLADHALHQAIAQATHNARLVELSARIRQEVSLGFDAEPYTAKVRQRALHQHPRLADAVIAGNPVLAGDCAASHFSLTENMLTELHARISLRSAGESDARSESE